MTLGCRLSLWMVVCLAPAPYQLARVARTGWPPRSRSRPLPPLLDGIWLAPLATPCCHARVENAAGLALAEPSSTFEFASSLFHPPMALDKQVPGIAADSRSNKQSKRIDEAVGHAPPASAAHPPPPEEEQQQEHGPSKDVRAALAGMKDVLVDKLSALHPPAEVIDAGRKSMENLIREVTHTYDNAKGAVTHTYDNARGAVIATKLRIVSSLPSAGGGAAKNAGQVTEDVERELLENAESHVPGTHHSKAYRNVEHKTRSRL